ncbi:cilia- and flagella-associated protein 206-like [Trichoplusia ni]|uniref:Cilia- and flagella-associated protein 206 n=1 Tax=Trichoplusia ni TaxID=7111 RepID=A0A7E5VMJ0_TRINI|nr:cilia- and flagella-associated protein 206-like [Trichoplusia ni]
MACNENEQLSILLEECVTKLERGGTALNTLKIQFILQTNYDKLQHLIDKHLKTIQKCLQPLHSEILDADPDPTNEAEMKKLFRKISIYIILASGLGNPGYIITLKEGMAALESVFLLDDLKTFVSLPRSEKSLQLEDLLALVSGVRLFNRTAKRGRGIPTSTVPFNLVDAGKACMASLSHSLITVMQRVNRLTTAIEDTIVVQERPSFIRKLLSDVESMTQKGAQYVERVKAVLEELHTAVKYKAAVPVVNVFPLFAKLWKVWRAMQNVMFLVSTVNRLMSILAFLGFCALCLSAGALVPSNMKIGLIKAKEAATGFCSVKMAARFSKDQRPKIKVFDKDIQTEDHPVESYKEKNYTSDLWEWKRRACQWASIVNCQTHSTQTYYSHLRSEVHCQTVEPRDKCLQTKKDTGMNTVPWNTYIWGLRGQKGCVQHTMKMKQRTSLPKPREETTMRLPCLEFRDSSTDVLTMQSHCY